MLNPKSSKSVPKDKVGHSTPVKKPEEQEGKPERAKKVSLRTVSIWAVCFALVGGLLGYFLTQPTFLSACPPFASTRVSITSPANGSGVPIEEIVQGTACHIPEGEELWLMVVFAGANYYPQNGPIQVDSTGKWSTTAYIGPTPADVGRGFVLSTALADQEGQAAIRGYFKTAPNFQPLKSPLKGIRLIDQIVVIRLASSSNPPTIESSTNDYNPLIVSGIFAVLAAVLGAATAGLLSIINDHWSGRKG